MHGAWLKIIERKTCGISNHFSSSSWAAGGYSPSVSDRWWSCPWGSMERQSDFLELVTEEFWPDFFCFWHISTVEEKLCYESRNYSPSWELSPKVELHAWQPVIQFSFPQETKPESLSPSQIILACVALAVVTFLPVQLNQLQQQWDGGERISCGELYAAFSHGEAVRCWWWSCPPK